MAVSAALSEMVPRHVQAGAGPAWIVARNRFGQIRSRAIPIGQSLMPQGSLILDLPRPRRTGPRVICHARMKSHFLRLENLNGERLVLSGKIFGRDWCVELDATSGAQAERQVVVLRWDMASGRGSLCLTDWHFNAVACREFAVPGALPVSLLRGMLAGLVPQGSAGAIAMAPVADALPAGVAGDAVFETSDGPCAAADLRPGMVLPDVAGLPVVLRRVAPVAMPAIGPWQPIELRPPYFGLTAPLLMAGAQEVLLGGADVEYLFDAELASLPLTHLQESHMVRHPDPGPLLNYIGLVPDRPAALRINGAWINMPCASLRPKAAPCSAKIPRMTQQDLQSLLHFRGLQVLS